MKIIIFIISFLIFNFLYANEIFRPVSKNDLHEKTEIDTFYFVPNSKVVYANYFALRRDFVELAHLSEKKIDEWIINVFAFISKAQLYLNGVRHTPILLDYSKTKQAFRPPEYKRAAVMPSSLISGGFVDVKGNGHGDFYAALSRVMICITLFIEEMRRVQIK